MKLAVSFGLLFFLLRSLAWGRIFSSLTQASPLWVGYALMAGFAQFWVAAWRWQLLLNSLGVQRLSLTTLARVYLMGGFFNNFAPANLGGDAARIVTLLGQRRNGAAITMSVILERILNLIGLGALGIWIFLAQPLRLTTKVNSSLGWWIGVASMGILCIVIGLWSWNPTFLRPWFSKVYEIAKIAWKNPWRLAETMMATVILHFTLMLITFSNSQAVSIFLPLDIQLAVYTLAGIAMALPITIQGIGIREGIYLGLFGALGIAPEITLAALALNYVILVIFSLLGGILVLAALHSSRRRTE